MRILRGVAAVDQLNHPKTIALLFDDEEAWIRFGKSGDDIPLSKDEVRELSKCFRQCVEHWKSIAQKAKR